MRWSLISLMAAAVLTVPAPTLATLQGTTSSRPARVNSRPSSEPPSSRYPAATSTTSCTGPPGAATNTAPPPATATGRTSPRRQLRDPTTKIKTYNCRG